MASEFLQDLQAGLSIFNQNVQQLTTQRAINAANEQVNAIRQSEASEEEKQQAFRNLAQDMTLRFMASGAPQSQIETFQNAFAPKPTVIQTAEQARIMGTTAQKAEGAKIQQEERDFKRQLELEKTERALDVAGIKAQGDIRKNVTKSLKDFRTVAKSELDSLDTLAQMPDKVTNNLEYVTKLKTFIKQSDPRISESDYAVAVPNTALRLRVKRAYEALKNNKPLEADAEVLDALQATMQAKLKSRLDKKITGYSRAQAPNIGIGANEFKDALNSQWNPDFQQQQAAPQTQEQPSAAAPQQQFAPGDPRKYFKPKGQ